MENQNEQVVDRAPAAPATEAREPRENKPMMRNRRRKKVCTETGRSDLCGYAWSSF